MIPQKRLDSSLTGEGVNMAAFYRGDKIMIFFPLQYLIVMPLKLSMNVGPNIILKKKEKKK